MNLTCSQEHRFSPVTESTSSFTGLSSHNEPLSDSSDMPPKVTPEIQALASRFEAFGLSTAKALEVASKPKQASALSTFLESTSVEQVNAKQANLLLQLSGSSLTQEKRALVTKEILDERLLSADQVTGASGCLFAVVWADRGDRGDQVLRNA